ncbi:hypothetical protein CR513_51362, partial [Mucuna pruriens]
MAITFTLQRCPCLYYSYYLHHHYDVNLHGDWFTVTVTAAASVAESWLSFVLHKNSESLAARTLVAGLGVQWTHRTDVPSHPADTLQLCVGEHCLIYQLSRADSVPAFLRYFLRDRACTFVGYCNRYARRMLSLSPHHIQLARDVPDVRRFLEEEFVGSSLESIVEAQLGYTGVKTTVDVNLSDWGAVTLTDDQVMQAALEARCVYLISHKLEVWRRHK